MNANPPQPEVAIVDTVCVLDFAASKQLDILIDTLTAANCRLFVPEEVLNEATNVAGRKNWGITQINALLARDDGRIQLIPMISQKTPGALTKFAELEKRHPRAGGHPDEHLGEYVVVTHALAAREQGHQVRVGLDDEDAIDMATKHGLACFRVEDALLLAVEHSILDANGARKAYEKMGPIGGSALPSWEASSVKARLGAAKNAAKARQQQQKVLDAVAASAESGLTAAEVAESTSIASTNTPTDLEGPG